MLVFEGASGSASGQLDGRTLLETARCSASAQLAERGRSGLLKPYPNMAKGRSEIGLGTLLGLSVKEAKALQPGPLSLAARREAGPYDLVFCGCLVNTDGERLLDPCIPLSADETRELVEALQRVSGGLDITLHVTAPGRFLAVFHHFRVNASEGLAPWQQVGSRIDACWPCAREDRRLESFRSLAEEILACHAVNDVRIDLGEIPANGVWLWGGGHMPGDFSGRPMPDRAACISDSPVARGLARQLGMETEAFDSASFAEVFERNIMGRDHLLIVASAETTGSARARVLHLDHLDFHITRPVMEYLQAWKDLRLALVSNGAVDADTGKPLSAKTPVVLYEPDVESDAVKQWSEGQARRGKAGILSATRLFDFFQKR